LSSGLRAFSTVLPNIDSFAVTEYISRGAWIPALAIANAGIVLFVFGLPLIVLAFVIFRNKEVARDGNEARNAERGVPS
jgi:hypothetical protein